jgi:hypothetical protein
LESLDIDKVWLKHYTELELIKVIAEIVESTDHDVIGLLSDDTIPTQESLDSILNAFEPSSVYTGYCNMEENNPEVNLSSEPLVVQHLADKDCYSFPLKTDVDAHEGLYPSYFTGFAMTFMSRQMWLKYPFNCIGDPGYQSDYSLSCRLQNDEVNIWAVPGAFMQHLKLAESTKHLEGGTVVVGNNLGEVVWDLKQ